MGPISNAGKALSPNNLTSLAPSFGHVIRRPRQSWAQRRVGDPAYN